MDTREAMLVLTTRRELVTDEQHLDAVAAYNAEVRRLRSERDAVLNMLEGRDVELARRLRAQIAFERGET